MGVWPVLGLSLLLWGNVGARYSDTMLEDLQQTWNSIRASRFDHHDSTANKHHVQSLQPSLRSHSQYYDLEESTSDERTRKKLEMRKSLESKKNKVKNVLTAGSIKAKEAREKLKSKFVDAKESGKKVKSKFDAIQKGSILKAASLGALGGAAAGFITRPPLEEGQSKFTGLAGTAITGAIAGIAADMSKQNQANRGRDMTGNNGLGKNAAVGAGIGAASYFLKSENQKLSTNILAGLAGGLAGSFASKGEAQFAGDGSLNYNEFLNAFDGREEISATELSLITEQPEPVVANFMNKVGTLDGNPAEAGGKVSVAQLAMYLDEDNSGLITVAELSPLFGNNRKAEKFMHDKDVGSSLDEEHVLLQGNERIPSDIFFLYARKFTSEADCIDEGKCSISPISLSMMSMPDAHVDFHNSISSQEALDLIKLIKTKLRDRSLPVTSEPGKVEFKELWSFLLCPECAPGETAGREDIGKKELNLLVKNSLQSRKLLLSILDAQYDSMSDYDRQEKKLERRFNQLNPMDAFVTDVGENMWEKHQKDVAKLLLKPPPEE